MTRLQPLILALAVIAMAVVGWNLGGNSGEKPATGPLPVNSRSSRPERVVRARPGPSGEAARRLEAIRATANPSERMRATIDLANSLSVADFAAWLGGAWFTPRGGMEAIVFKQILLERWRQEDPEGLLLWHRENASEAADSMFSAWAETEPQRLLDFFKKHPYNEAELGALSQIAEKHPELALRRLQEMIAAGMPSDELSRSEFVIEVLAKQAPAALEAILDALPVALKSDAEEILISRKMQDAFATELRKLQERPDGFQLLFGIYARNNELEGKLIDKLTDLPASWRDQIASRVDIFIRSDDATKWAAADLEGAGFTAEQTRDIRAVAVSRLLSSEPEAAFEILVVLDLPQDQKERMLRSLSQSLRDTPEKAEALLTRLGSEEERQIARKAFQPTQNVEPEIKPIEQPAEWLATVGALAGGYTPAIYFDMVRDWEPGKIAALVTGFQSLPEEQKFHLARIIGSNDYFDDYPLRGMALAYIVAHPSEKLFSDDPDPFAEPDPRDGTSQTIALATDYAVRLAKENPEQAGDWIQALPDGDAKFYAAKNLQSVWSLYDPAAAERWLKSLPAATREKVKELQ